MKKASSHPKLLALLMLSAGLSASAYDFEAGGLYYNVLSAENKTVEVTCKDEENNDSYVTDNVVIPETVTNNSNTYAVAAIGDHAFAYCYHLTSVTLPNSVTSIGDGAFDSCENLTSVTLPNSVTTIGDWAFSGCEYLSSVTISNSVASIGSYAFSNCISLTTVTIPNSVTSIGDEVFSGCSNLDNINVDAENAYYSSIDGILYNKDATTLISCPEKRESVTIPNSVTVIGDSAFKSCRGLTSVTIPNSVTTIGSYAFSYCTSLTAVTIPNSVTTVEWYAFYCCAGLTSITMPNSLTTIGDFVFAECSGLTSVTIPNSVTSIGDFAFDECSGLTSVTIPDSVTTIGEGAFDECSGLTSVTIPNSVTSIGDGAFAGCFSLKTVYMQCEVPVECKPYFTEAVLKEATLYVPTGTMEAYKGVDPWKNFTNIMEMDFSGVEEVDASESEAIRISVENGVLSIGGLDAQTNITIYDMQGRTVYSGQNRSIGGLTRGLYILKVGTKTLKFSI